MAVTKKKSVSVVIPNYNGKSLLEKNIPSVLKALAKVGLDYEIIVPDDSSSDDSVAFLREQFPQILVIEGNVNLGFSGNINRGLRQASKDLVLLLNSDIFLDENYFEHQLNYFENPQTFGVMGAIYDSSTKKNVQLDLYPNQNFWGFVKAIGIPGYTFEKPTALYFLSGSNALVDRQKLIELNFFNEIFSPFYGEDADLGLRAWRTGWDSYYDPRSICYHQGAATISKFNKLQKIRLISRRNKMLFHEAHLEEGVPRAKFKIKMTIDFLTRWVIGDFGYYAAYRQYLQRRGSLQEFLKTQTFLLSTTEALLKIKLKIHEGIV